MLPAKPTTGRQQNQSRRRRGSADIASRRIVMRTYAVVLLSLLCLCCENDLAVAQQANSCKVRSDQQRACMKSYAGPTCKTEYRLWLKSCQKKSARTSNVGQHVRDHNQL